jgi:hypothetical protein
MQAGERPATTTAQADSLRYKLAAQFLAAGALGSVVILP